MRMNDSGSVIEMKRERSPLSIRVRGMLIAFALLLMAGTWFVAAPQGVSAAGPSVTACFYYSSGVAYDRKPVYLKIAQNGQWVTARSGNTNASGCATFTNVTANRTYAIFAQWTYKGNYWTEWIGGVPLTHYTIYKYEGWSGSRAVGTASVNLRGWYVYGPYVVANV